MTLVSRPLVSIIMNCFNCQSFLKEAIESVYAQTYDRWEIILWDNASTDRSSNIIKLFDDKIKYFRSNKTVPLYEARNMALEVCCGEVVAFLDCDDVWMFDKLEKQIQLYLSGARIVYGAFELIDADGGRIEAKLPKVRSGKITNNLLLRNMVSIGSVLIDKNFIVSHKFDPKFNLLGDFELWIRLSLLEEFYCVKGTVELSRHHQNNFSKTCKNDWIIEERYLYKRLLKIKSAIRLPVLVFFIIKCEFKNILMYARRIL